MSSHFDVIVIGVGSMGSAACWHLARRGHRVLGLEQFSIPHERGSHAGQSRIIRKAYFEHPDYVPLLERAYALWRAFEAETGEPLYYRTGIVYFGKPDNVNLAGVRKAARLHEIPITVYDADGARTKYPWFTVPGDFEAIFEPDAGFVRPERTVELFAREAVRLGAVIHSNTAVTGWQEVGGGLRVSTASAEYTCEKLVITAGAWSSRMIPAMAHSLRVTRQLLAWVRPPDAGLFAAGRFPCWFVEDPQLGTFYGFPQLSAEEHRGPVGLKLAHHHPGEPCLPEDIGKPAGREETEKLRQFLKRYLPGAGGEIIATKQCLYTNSPDADFIIDHLPGYDKRVTIACGFSGHGFKFVPVVGEVLADLAMEGGTELPVQFLKIPGSGSLLSGKRK